MRTQNNRLVMIGALWYLFEFAFIIAFYKTPPDATQSLGEFAAFLSTRQTHMVYYALGVSFAGLGRIIFAFSLRHAFRLAQETRLWFDLATAFMVVSVIVEMVHMGLNGLAASAASLGSDAAIGTAAVILVSGQPSVFSGLAAMAFGLSSLTAAWATLQAGSRPRWLSRLGVAGAVMFLPVIMPELFPESSINILSPFQFIGWLSIVIWMLGSGITLIRPAAKLSAAPTAG